VRHEPVETGAGSASPQAMDPSRIRKAIANLSRHAYSSFIVEFFSADGEKEGHEGFYPLPAAGEDVFYQPLLDSYGGSIHRVYLLHFPPWQLFHPREQPDLDDPVLAKKLARVRNLYKGEVGYWGWLIPISEGARSFMLLVLLQICSVSREKPMAII
jgi:hypothetical protein